MDLQFSFMLILVMANGRSLPATNGAQSVPDPEARDECRPRCNALEKRLRLINFLNELIFGSSRLVLLPWR